MHFFFPGERDAGAEGRNRCTEPCPAARTVFPHGWSWGPTRHTSSWAPTRAYGGPRRADVGVALPWVGPQCPVEFSRRRVCPGHLTLNHNGRSRVPEGRPPAHLLTNNSSSRPCYWPGGAKLSYFGAPAGGGQAPHLSWRHQRVAQVGIWAGGVSKKLGMAAVWPEL